MSLNLRNRAGAITCTFLLASTCHGAVIMSNWVGGGGDTNWDTANNWSPAQVPNNGLDTFDVTIPGGGPHLGSGIEIDRLTLENFATINGSGSSFIVKQDTDINNSGRFDGSGLFMAEGPVTVDGSLILDNWLATTTQLTLGEFGFFDSGVILNNAAILTNDGVVELRTDGDFSDFGGNPLFENNGLLTKTGGTGISDIIVDVTDNTGQINVSTGQLRFFGDVTLNGTMLNATSNSLLTIRGPTLNMNGATSTTFTNGGEINFGNGDVAMTGTLTSSGDGKVTATSPAMLSGGTLSCAAGAPFVQDDADVDGVVNAGFYEWIRGTINGGGLTNDPGATLYTGTTTGVVQRIIDGATFTNRGAVKQDHDIRTDEDGFIDHSEGSWTMTNATVSNLVTADTSGFTAAAPIIVGDGITPGNAKIMISFSGSSSITVNKGTLQFTTSTADITDGPVFVGDGSGDAATLIFGNLLTDQTSLDNVPFTLFDGGATQWRGGTHVLKGAITAAGANGEMRNDGGTLASDALFGASLTCSPLTPFVMNSANAKLCADGPFTIDGATEWILGEVIGTNAVTHTGDMTVTGSVNISDGFGGYLINMGTMTFDTGNSQIAFNSQGQFDNQGTVLIPSGGDFGKAPISAAMTMITNTGTFLKTGTGATEINVPFDHLTGRFGTSDGLISMMDTTRLLGGSVEATAGDAKIDIPVNSVSKNVSFDLDNGGEIEYRGSADHEIGGLLGAGLFSGVGRVKLGGGNMHTSVGDNTTLMFANSTSFETSGNPTIDASLASLTNCGNFIMGGGTIVGDFRNGFGCPANFTFSSGNIDTLFQNQSGFTWSGGRLIGQMQNDANATTSGFRITAASSPRIDANALLTNHGLVTHQPTGGGGTLLFGNLSRIDNFGTYQLKDAANISPVAGGDVGDFLNAGVTIRRGQFSSTIRMRFDNQGELRAEQGQLTLTDPVQFAAGVLTGGTWRIGPAGSLQLVSFNQPVTEIGTNAFVSITSNGDLVNPPTAATLAPFALAGQLALSDAGLFSTGDEFNITSTGVLSVSSDGVLTAQTVNNYGVINGASAVDATVINHNIVSPGASPGALTVTEFVNGSNGVLEIELAGMSPGVEHDVLVVTGAATLGGTISVSTTHGFSPGDGDTFVVVTAGAITGTFDQLTGPSVYSVDVSSNAVTLTANCPAADADCDGDVDETDYAVFADCVAGPGVMPAPSDPGNSTGDCLDVFDADLDGDVDLSDYMWFQVLFAPF